jgi:D-lactate dehydrogenase
MIDASDLGAILKKVQMFSTLDDRCLSEMSRSLKRIELGPGEVLCQEGEMGGSMFIVESGSIRVLKRGNAGTPVEIAVLGRGEVAGIMSLFGDDSRSATMRAVESTILWEMRSSEFQELLSRNPLISKAMIDILSRYVRENNRTIADLRTRDIDTRLKVAVFDAKPYTRSTFVEKCGERFALKFFDARLSEDTASMAEGFRVACCFVNDVVDARTAKKLKALGVELVALRCAGYNNVDLDACAGNGIQVTYVPNYSPYAVAEHAVTLMLALNRHVNRAHARVRESNFSLDGLVGFDMHGKVAGVVGAGRIGQCVIDILCGFGCRVLVYNRTPRDDPRPNVHYAGLDELLASADIVTLHAPLVSETRHLIDDASIAKMKDGAMLINTGRGGLVDTHALVRGLLSGKIGSAGLDVYEEEGGYFFEDFSNKVLKDEVLARLTTFPNVIVTPHMAFLTEEALLDIAEITLGSIGAFEQGKHGADLPNALTK